MQGRTRFTTSFTYTINKATVTAPTAVTGLTYTGSEQTGVSAADTTYTVSNGSATSAGNYTAVATLADSKNYEWVKGTTTNADGNAEISWSIAAQDASKATVTLSPTEYTYDGSAKEPTPTVKVGDITLTKDTDYTVSYSDNTNAGTAKATITFKGNYAGTTSKEFTIKKVQVEVPTAKNRSDL